MNEETIRGGVDDETADQMSIQQFVSRHGITLDAKPVSLCAEWTVDDKHAQSWECTLKCGKREMVTSFTKGSGHRTWNKLRYHGGVDRPRGHAAGQPAQLPWGASTYDKQRFYAWTAPTPPTAEEVLDCLASEASAMDQSFEDWASDFGYDVDSRKAEKAYNACREQGFALRKLLGYADFEILLNRVERM